MELFLSSTLLPMFPLSLSWLPVWKYVFISEQQGRPLGQMEKCRKGSMCRDHSGYGLRWWERALLCNAFSHWLSSYPEWCSGVYIYGKLDLFQYKDHYSWSMNSHYKDKRDKSLDLLTFVVRWHLYSGCCHRITPYISCQWVGARKM